MHVTIAISTQILFVRLIVNYPRESIRSLDSELPARIYVECIAPLPMQAANPVLIDDTQYLKRAIPKGTVRPSSAAHTSFIEASDSGVHFRLPPSTPGAPMCWEGIPDYDLASNPALK